MSKRPGPHEVRTLPSVRQFDRRVSEMVVAIVHPVLYMFIHLGMSSGHRWRQGNTTARRDIHFFVSLVVCHTTTPKNPIDPSIRSVPSAPRTRAEDVEVSAAASQPSHHHSCNQSITISPDKQSQHGNARKKLRRLVCSGIRMRWCNSV